MGWSDGWEPPNDYDQDLFDAIVDDDDAEDDDTGASEDSDEEE